MTNRHRSHTGRDIALVAVFAAFITVCALLPAFPVGPAGVPITFQTLGIYLTALVLGGKRGALAALLYLVVGFIGLPVFAGGGAGIGTLAAPSAGYLVSYPIGAFIIGALGYSFLRRRRGNASIVWQVIAALAGFVFITACGVAGMMINAHLSLPVALGAAALYIPGDLIKAVIAALVALAVHRAFPALAANGLATRPNDHATNR
ncbi:biotin transporter BioY [Rothia sp. LK2588]|uniref:biotin transporter BioY n=1 Tax=Rothia sp. LK2588 TaxID=3114369 RepID=UPI0034CE27F7